MGRNLLPITEEIIKPLITKHRGNIAAIARELRCDRATVWSRIKDNEELKRHIVSTREALFDDLETSIWDKALGGDTIMQIFLAKTQLWRRGYTERKQVAIDISQTDDHQADNQNIMTLATWRVMQAKNIAAVDASLALFEDDDDPNVIDAEFKQI